MGKDALESISWREPALIVVVCLTLYLTGSAKTGLWDRDEPRNAVAVHEMRARGDWLFPTFNGEPRYHKPILIYWLMGASTAVLGETPIGARLPSAASGTAVCLLVWMLGRRMFGPRVGLISALMLAVAPIMVAESRLATPDATLLLWMTGCQVCLWELSRRDAPELAAAFWLSLGLAVLTKGPVGPAILATAGLLAWRWGFPLGEAWRRLHPRRGVVGFALVSAPWYLVVLLGSDGRFVEVAVNQQFMQRLSTGMEEHGGFPGYYAAVSALVFFPWSGLAPMAVLAAWRRRTLDHRLAFLLGLVVGPMIMLECVQTKLIHYYLPSYPACALLAAWVVVGACRDGEPLRLRPLGRLAHGMIGGIGAAAGVGMTAAAAAVAPAAVRLPLAVCGLVVAAGTLFSLSRLRRAQTSRGTFGLIATAGLMMLIIGGWLIPSAEPARVSRVVGERLAAIEAETGLEPVLMNYQEPGVIYAMGKPVAGARDPREFLARLREKRALVTAVTPEELGLLATKFGITLTPIEEVHGFNPARGSRYTLVLAVARPGAGEAAARPVESTARSAAVEQPVVK